MAKKLESATPTFPYVSFATWKVKIRELAPAGHPPPKKIERGMLSTMSNSAISQFMASLRFFGLVRDDDSTTPEFAVVAQASESDWKIHLKRMLQERYESQLDELRDGTPGTYKQSFGEIGAIAVPASRFLLQAARDVGLPINHHIKEIPSDRKPSKKKPEAASTTPTGGFVGGGGNGGGNAPAASSAESYRTAVFMKIVDDLHDLKTEDMEAEAVFALVNQWRATVRLLNSVSAKP